MALSYLSGIINKNNNMEDIGIIYPTSKKGRPNRKVRIKNLKNRNEYNLKRFEKLQATLKKASDPRIKKLLLKQIDTMKNKYKLGELGKPKRKIFSKAKSIVKNPIKTIKRTKAQLISKVKTTLKKAKERRKADKHSPKEKALHMIAKKALLIPRGAFLGLILLGKALEKSPIKFNLAQRLKDSWPSKGKQLSEVWYKLGGEEDILKAQISKATNSKLSGSMGVAVAATVAGSVAAATPIIVKILNVIGKGAEFAQKNPKLVAVGEKLLKNKLDQVAKKEGKTEELAEVREVVSELTESLPATTKEQVEEAKDEIPNSTIETVNEKTENEVEQTKENIQAESNNEGVNGSIDTKTVLIGAAVLVGGYLLMKKK